MSSVTPHIREIASLHSLHNILQNAKIEVDEKTGSRYVEIGKQHVSLNQIVNKMKSLTAKLEKENHMNDKIRGDGAGVCAEIKRLDDDGKSKIKQILAANAGKMKFLNIEQKHKIRQFFNLFSDPKASIDKYKKEHFSLKEQIEKRKPAFMPGKKPVDKPAGKIQLQPHRNYHVGREEAEGKPATATKGPKEPRSKERTGDQMEIRDRLEKHLSERPARTALLTKTIEYFDHLAKATGKKASFLHENADFLKEVKGSNGNTVFHNFLDDRHLRREHIPSIVALVKAHPELLTLENKEDLNAIDYAISRTKNDKDNLLVLMELRAEIHKET